MVKVSVSEGVLEGSHEKNEYGGTFYSFKGIPYAEPPLGDLRFKAPQPPKPWTGVRSAKDFGPICFQMNPITKTPWGSEDCLYLNIYTPNLTPEKPLPVMFYIHGGSFAIGSSNDDMYGPEFLIRHDVILVTINYRLEVLGFLGLDSKDAPGNAGMKDQVQAMRWVKKNISSFGGDPENITIFGNSAGGVCVSFHLMSPITKGLFRRAIMQSGTCTCFWSMPFEPREVVLALAKQLGCHSSDNKVLYEFFKVQPVDSLINLQIPTTMAIKAKNSSEIYFAVVSEKNFDNVERYWSGNSYDGVRSGIHEGVEVMNGYVEDEGIMTAIMTCRNDFTVLMPRFNQFLEEYVPRPITWHCKLADQFEVGRQIKQFYFQDKKMTFEVINDLVRMFSMAAMVYDIIQWQKITAGSSSNKLYFYRFSCKSERNIMANMFGYWKVVGDKKTTCHVDDLAYLFPCKGRIKRTEPGTKTFQMIDNVTKLWTNFAKFGNPTPDDSLGVQWTPFTLEKQTYLDIGEDLKLCANPEEDQLQFWEDIYKRYLPHRSHI
ncbi:juvenile hormone esterase-like [Cydia strobilella]|uniref:juvenile hormone esterase-like n=1 Tax=Cydia strobilella TaxID=1100964 RepID=UPI003005CEC0